MAQTPLRYALFGTFLMGSLFAASPPIFSAESAPAVAPKAAPATTPPAAASDQKTIVGEVVDPGAYLKEGRHGTDATEQTYTAVDGGQTLAILENGTNDLYLLLAEQTGEDPNELVYDYVNQQVTAKGRIYEKGGVRGLVATAVEPVASTAAAAAATPPATATP